MREAAIMTIAIHRQIAAKPALLTSHAIIIKARQRACKTTAKQQDQAAANGLHLLNILVSSGKASAIILKKQEQSTAVYAMRTIHHSPTPIASKEYAHYSEIVMPIPQTAHV